MQLAITYAILGVIATATNITAQDISIRLYPGSFGVLASVATGTVTGLMTKYFLDKRYIFRFRAESVAHDSATFLRYSLMGIFTTAIFWGAEFGFHYVFGTKEMRYIGAIIGLGIGYLAKYHLDKRYVFIHGVA